MVCKKYNEEKHPLNLEFKIKLEVLKSNAKRDEEIKKLLKIVLDLQIKIDSLL